jgi:diacylglycerol kinase (ATP)
VTAPGQSDHVQPSSLGYKPEPTGALRRLIRALGFSFDGLKATWRSEWAFRVDVAVFVLFAPLALWLGHGGVERALLVGSLFLVLIAELVNSGIEAVVDRFGPDRHEFSKKAKDVGSAIVLMALLNAGAVWLLILFERMS